MYKFIRFIRQNGIVRKMGRINQFVIARSVSDVAISCSEGGDRFASLAMTVREIYQFLQPKDRWLSY